MEKSTDPFGKLQISGTMNFEWAPRNLGREMETKKSTTTYYKCGDHYFLVHYCQNKAVMAVEEVLS